MTCQHVFYAMKECECNTDKPKNALKFDPNKRNADDLKLDADFVDGAVDLVANVTEAATVKCRAVRGTHYRRELPKETDERCAANADGQLPERSSDILSRSYSIPIDML